MRAEDPGVVFAVIDQARFGVSGEMILGTSVLQRAMAS